MTNESKRVAELEAELAILRAGALPHTADETMVLAAVTAWPMFENLSRGDQAKLLWRTMRESWLSRKH